MGAVKSCGHEKWIPARSRVTAVGALRQTKVKVRTYSEAWRKESLQDFVAEWLVYGYVGQSWRDDLDCDKRLLYESCGSSGSVVVFDERTSREGEGDK
jgi:hypothetical protein